jgi:hypothetical protein
VKRRTVSLFVLGFLVTAPLCALQIEPPPLPMERTSLYDAAQAGGALRQGSFEVNLVITDSRKGLPNWLAMSAGERVRSQRPHRFRAFQKGYLSVVLTNFKTEDVNVDLTAQLMLIGPDGRSVYEHRNLGRSAWGNPKQGYLAIRPDVDFSFDKTDPVGTYTYRVIVSDNVRGEIGRAEQKIVFAR